MYEMYTVSPYFFIYRNIRFQTKKKKQMSHVVIILWIRNVCFRSVPFPNVAVIWIASLMWEMICRYSMGTATWSESDWKFISVSHFCPKIKIAKKKKKIIRVMNSLKTTYAWVVSSQPTAVAGASLGSAFFCEFLNFVGACLKIVYFNFLSTSWLSNFLSALFTVIVIRLIKWMKLQNATFRSLPFPLPVQLMLWMYFGLIRKFINLWSTCRPSAFPSSPPIVWTRLDWNVIRGITWEHTVSTFDWFCWG